MQRTALHEENLVDVTELVCKADRLAMQNPSILRQRVYVLARSATSPEPQLLDWYSRAALQNQKRGISLEALICHLRLAMKSFP